MKPIAIVSLEDEPEVREAILRDLEPLAPHFDIEAAEDVEVARDLIKTLKAEGRQVGLIFCDHRLPGTSGVEFLTQLHADPETQAMRKVLLTGQADHQDTIRAINQAGLHHYIAKPWRSEELIDTAKRELTEFLLDQKISPLPYLEVLDDPRLLDLLSKSSMID